ncbi:MAG: hypothetical protein Q4P17_10515 [Methanobacterium sp.]|nr:hypothetical protein [Methanobacterium sp.]
MNVNILENFTKYNEYFLFGSLEMKDLYKFNYQSFMPEHEHAQCVMCAVFVKNTVPRVSG